MGVEVSKDDASLMKVLQGLSELEGQISGPMLGHFGPVEVDVVEQGLTGVQLQAEKYAITTLKIVLQLHHMWMLSHLVLLDSVSVGLDLGVSEALLRENLECHLFHRRLLDSLDDN